MHCLFGQSTRTRRLDAGPLVLVAASLAHVEAELEAPGCLASMLGAEVCGGWPPGEYDRGAQEYFRDRLREGGLDAEGWYGWYALLPGAGGGGSRRLAGACGYFGPPDADGRVEVGFSVLPEHEGAGLATHMASALVRNALAQARVAEVRARTSVDNAASRRVLEKAGFRLLGESGEPGVLDFVVRK